MIAFDAFISYSTRDKATADAACAALEATGIRCWIAPRDIIPGSDWGASILEALDQCRVMVLIFSLSANNSPQIRREIERVVSKGIPVVPVRIEDIAPTKAMAYFMGPVHWLDALTPPLEQHLQRLAESVKNLLAIDTDPARNVDPNRTDRMGRQPPPGAEEVDKASPSMRAGALEKEISTTKSGGAKPTSASIDSISAPLSPQLKYPPLIAIAITGTLAYLFLIAQDTVNFTAAAAFAGALYWFVYRNLNGDRSVAKIATVVCSVIGGYFIALNLIAQNLTLAAIEAFTVGCLLYTFTQLLKVQGTPRVD